MKTTLAITLSFTIWLTTATAQITREEREALFQQSRADAVIQYPAIMDPTSPIALLALKIDDELKASNDPLYFSPEKPLLLARLAAMRLGISPAKPMATPAQAPSTPLPKLVTGEQVKELWLKANPVPHKLSPDWQSLQKLHEAFKAGYFDQAAQLTAHEINAARLAEAGFVGKAEAMRRLILEYEAATLGSRTGERQRSMHGRIMMDLEEKGVLQDLTPP